MNLENTILDQKTISVPFKFGKYLRQGWQITWQRFVSFFFVGLALGILQAFATRVMGTYWEMVMTFLVVPAFTAGCYIAANKLRTEDFHTFDDFIPDFAQVSQLSLAKVTQILGYILMLVPLVLFINAISLLAGYQTMLLGGFSAFKAMDNKTVALIIGIVFLYLYFYISLLLTDQYIVFKAQNYWQAMASSFRKTHQYWFQFLGLQLTLFLGIIVYLCITFPLYLFWLMTDVLDLERKNYALALNALFLEPTQTLDMFPGKYVAIQLLIALVLPFIYNTLHAAFADLEGLDD
ncbi:MAG: hypothetical protein RLZZ292_1972 [Bacteroidota bacterium]|jgi:hypothetical protein